MSYFPPKFQQDVKNAIERVKDILGTTRNPTLASEVDHAYSDKFSLATWATSVTAMGLLNALEPIGLAPEIVEKYRKMHENGKTVNMHYEYKTSATFIKETEKEVDSGRKAVTETTGGIFGTKSTKTTKVIHTVKEYHWTITSTWKLSLYTGAEMKTDTETVLFNRNGTYDLKVVGTERNPLHGRSRADTLKVPFNWILGLLNGNGNLEFKIDRGKDTCKTPVRNDNVEEALKFFASFEKFISKAPSYAITIGNIEVDQAKDDTFKSLRDGFKDMIENVSLPVFPFMEKRTGNDDDDSSSSSDVLMKMEDVHQILAQQKKDLLNIVNETSKLVPSSEDGNLVTVKEVLFLGISIHIKRMCGNYSDTIQYIERMLYDQLKKAVGKEITGKAFDEYMRFHNQKIYKEEYLPKPFCYAIRRPDHYPEGVLSIESSTSPTNADPILTSMRKGQAGSVHTMYFSLNAATNVEFNGDRYLHACVNNQFNKRKQSFQIHARARQFSSFVLMIGTIPTAKRFDVKHAIIVKDKDDLIIPLLMETIPTAKEFKEAISSLSPEQQRFANAYRNMQLSSTLFALGVVQIKPQLEKVLNLPHDSLTKEIKLTQSLMDLFIEYQISSDLISYDSNSDGGFTPSQTPTDSATSNSPTLVALNQVKKHVEKMLDMIAELKQEDLKKKTELKLAEVLSSDSEFDDDDDDCEEEIVAKKRKGARRVGKMAENLLNSATTFRKSLKSAPPMSASMRYADSAPPPPPSSRTGGGGRGPPGMRLQRQQQQVAATAASHIPQKQDDVVQKGDNNVRNEDNEGCDEGFDVDDNTEDYTSIPKLLEKRCAAVDPTAKLRPTILKVGDNWKHKYKRSILSKEATRVMNEQDQSKEKSKAMDLLDALSKSGALSLDAVELHIVVVSTHCFEKTVVDTVIQDNENPIEHIERSLLAMSSAMQQKPVGELVKNSEVQRLQDMSPTLFPSLAD